MSKATSTVDSFVNPTKKRRLSSGSLNIYNGKIDEPKAASPSPTQSRKKRARKTNQEIDTNNHVVNMNSKQRRKVYVAKNKIPKDAVSAVDADDGKYYQSTNTKDTMSILFWLEWHAGHHYVGYLGQQSYSYATPNDIIIAYNYSGMDKDWFLWLLRINKLSPAQFLWINGENFPQFKHMEKDEYLLKQISLLIEQKMTDNSSLSVHLKPFAILPSSQRIINTIKSNISINNNKDNIITFGADIEWANKFANKTCLHRSISTPNKPSLFEECKVYSEVNGLSECAGYVCQSKDELLIAYSKLTKEIGRNRVVIKDCHGVSGDDIFFYNSKQEIIDNFVWKKEYKYMEMEEDLRYNDDEIEKVEFIGMQFYDNEVLGVADQILDDGVCYAGSMSYGNKEIGEELKRIGGGVMKKIGGRYMGGFDFAIQTFKDKKLKPKIYLVDMNTGRYTAPMQSLVFMKKFGITDKYFIRLSMQIKKGAAFKELIEENSDILFNMNTKRGVYFHMFGVNFGQAIVAIFGNDERDANDILNKLKSIKSLYP